MNSISELEGVVLGIVRSLQPCTAYAVRKRLASSPSTHWSASGGSIYPLLSRLERAGLVQAHVDEGDGRRSRLVTLTPKGERALRDWILTAGTPEVAENVSDALRSRAFFLDVLSASDRRRFAEEALAAAEAHLARARAYRDEEAPFGVGASEGGDEPEVGESRFGHLAAVAGVYAAEARVRWLEELVAEMGGEGP